MEYVKERCSLATALAGEGLSDEDRTVFYTTLRLIASNLQKLSQQGIPYPYTSILEGDLK